MTLTIALSEALSDASRTFSRDQAAQDAMDAELLAEYGVASTDDLPFNYGGYRLQYSEEFTHPLFEAFYADLEATYGKQDQVIALFSFS